MSENKVNKEAGIEIPAINEKEVVKWDELISMYNEIKGFLEQSLNVTKNTGETFGSIIESNREIATTYVGAIKSLTDYSQELINILGTHSESNKLKNGSTAYNAYVGDVDVNDDKQQQLYVTVVVAYSGLHEKIQTTFESIETHLLGLIRAEVAKQEAEKPTEEK